MLRGTPQEVGKGVAALFDCRFALWGHGEFAQFDRGGQQSGEVICVFGPGLRLIHCDEFLDFCHTVSPAQAETAFALLSL